jgi:hypothetical protein
MAHDVTDAAGSGPCEDLYQRDFYTWALEQGRALRAHHTEAIDWENLAEEVEGLGRSEARELEGRLEVLLLHLLKWRYQPKKRSRSWRLSIREQRQRVARELRQNLGLQTTLAESVSGAYESARLVAARETKLAERTFPLTSPWIFGQINDPDFWPNS